jgi:hypothetical protein
VIEIATYVQIPEGPVVPVKDATALADDFYVEGALLLRVDGIQVMDFDLKDDALSLWYDLANLVTAYLSDGTAMTYFPDQPIELSLLPGDDETTVRWSLTNLPHPSSTEVQLVELVESLAAGAEHFFREMARLRPDDRHYFDDERERWAALVTRARSRG